jgi:hypothetical protein
MPPGDPPVSPQTPRPTVTPPTSPTGEGNEGGSDDATSGDTHPHCTGSMLLVQVKRGKDVFEYYQWCDTAHWVDCVTWYNKNQNNDFTVQAHDFTTIDKQACCGKFPFIVDRLIEDYSPQWANRTRKDTLPLKDAKLNPPSEQRFGSDYRPKKFSTMDMLQKGKERRERERLLNSKKSRKSKLEAHRARDP